MKIVILGAKNPETGRMIEAIRAAGGDDDFIGFIDNNHANLPPSFLGLPIFGGFERLDALIADDCAFVNTITGSTRARYETSREIVGHGGRLVNFIHPNVDPRFERGVGNYIQECAIQADVEMGDNCSIHVGCIIAHEARIGHSTFVTFGVNVAGEVAIGDGVFIGAGATIIPRIKIGNWATIGAGAVVIADIPDYAVAVGNPARIIRYNDKTYTDGRI